MLYTDLIYTDLIYAAYILFMLHTVSHNSSPHAEQSKRGKQELGTPWYRLWSPVSICLSACLPAYLSVSMFVC